MNPTSSTSTIQPLIGPFGLGDGNDGVDATLDINCLSTDRWILALYFWDLDELSCCVNIARHIAAALNQNAGHRYILGPTDREWQQFFSNHPAPFHAVNIECKFEGSMVEIQAADGTALAYRKVWDSFAQATADAARICEALNLSAYVDAPQISQS